MARWISEQTRSKSFASSAGHASERSQWACSPSTRSASRLVARMWTLGAWPKISSASVAVASMTCSQVARTDDEPTRGTRDQLAMTRDLACTFDQRDQNVECSVSQCERNAVALELAPRRQQPERPERYTPCVRSIHGEGSEKGVP